MELKEAQRGEPVKEDKSMTVKSTHSMSMLSGSPRSKNSHGGNQFWRDKLSTPSAATPWVLTKGNTGGGTLSGAGLPLRHRRVTPPQTSIRVSTHLLMTISSDQTTSKTIMTPTREPTRRPATAATTVNGLSQLSSLKSSKRSDRRQAQRP